MTDFTLPCPGERPWAECEGPRRPVGNAFVGERVVIQYHCDRCAYACHYATEIIEGARLLSEPVEEP